MAETPGAMPTLGEQTTIRAKLGLVLFLGGSLGGGIIWLTNMYNRQIRQEEIIQDIKSDVRDIKVDMRRFTDSRVGIAP